MDYNRDGGQNGRFPNSGYNSNSKNNNSSQSQNQQQIRGLSPSEIQTEFNKMSADFGDYADKRIQELDKDNYGNFKLTTNQIRNILAMISDLQIKESIGQGNLNDETIQGLRYIRVKIAYAIGRDDGDKLGMRNFNDKSHIYEFLNCIGTDRTKFKLYRNYVEALVAYHKYHGGKN
jgi:CRISPR-associated protein Csm2